MTNSANPDQLASSLEANYLDLHCLQRQGISGFSRTRINVPSIYFGSNVVFIGLQILIVSIYAVYHFMGRFRRPQIDDIFLIFPRKIGCMKCQSPTGKK